MRLKSLLTSTVSLIAMSASAQFEDKLFPEVPIGIGVQYRGGFGLVYEENPVQLTANITALPNISYNYFDTRGIVGLLSAGVEVPVLGNSEGMNRHNSNDYRGSIGEKQVNTYAEAGIFYRRDCYGQASLYGVSLKQNFVKATGSDKLVPITAVELKMGFQNERHGLTAAFGIESKRIDSRKNFPADRPFSKEPVALYFMARYNLNF